MKSAQDAVLVAMTDIGGWPHWEIQFDKAGNTDAATRAALLEQITGTDLSDLIVMSHGWNSSPDHARQLYEQWFGMLAPLLPHGSAARIGTVGVIWPAMLWPDEPQPSSTATAGGGAAALPGPAAASGPPGASVAALSAVYPDSEQRQILSQLAALLDAQSPEPQALGQFHDLMRALSATEPQTIGLEDSGPLAMLNENPETLATRFAAALDTATAQATTGAAATGAAQTFDEGGAADLPDITPTDTGQGAAGGIGNITARLWNGAKEALRQFTSAPLGFGVVCTTQPVAADAGTAAEATMAMAAMANAPRRPADARQFMRSSPSRSTSTVPCACAMCGAWDAADSLTGNTIRQHFLCGSHALLR